MEPLTALADLCGGTFSRDGQATLGRMAVLKSSGVDHYVVGFGRYENADGCKRELDRFVTQVVSRL